MTHNVVFLIDSYSGPWAGTERQLWYLLEGMDRKRFEPHVFLLRHSEYSLHAESWPCPVQVIGIKRLLSPGGIMGLIRLTRMLRAVNARIVHAFFQDSSLLGPVAARLAGARYVAGRRDMGIWYTHSNLRYLRLLGRLANRVIANSNAVRELVADEEGIPGSRISVIYNGLEPGRDDVHDRTPLDERIPAGAPVIGIVANLRPVKRHADLIRAFADIRQAVPAAHLVIVGEGDLEASLRQLAAAEGVAANTHFMGKIKDPSGLVRRFTVAVLCSESEGFSNALMEYLKEGKPVVCTNVGGNPELVADAVNGFLVSVGDVRDLAERIRQIVEDPALAGRLGAAAFASVKGFTVGEMVHKHMDVYASLLSIPAAVSE